ncbi:hypothetical protein BGX38DRAFT_1191476, partial [Terfezia claveryi]
ETNGGPPSPLGSPLNAGSPLSASSPRYSSSSSSSTASDSAPASPQPSPTPPPPPSSPPLTCPPRQFPRHHQHHQHQHGRRAPLATPWPLRRQSTPESNPPQTTPTSPSSPSSRPPMPTSTTGQLPPRPISPEPRAHRMVPAVEVGWGGRVGGISAGLYGLSGLNLSNTNQHYMRPRRSRTGFGEVEKEREEPTPSGARDPRVYVTSPGGTTSSGKARSRPALRQRWGHHGTESDESPYDSGEEHGESTRLLGGGDRRSRTGGACARSTDGRSIMDIPRRDSHLLGASVGGGMNYGSVNFPPSVPTSPRLEPALYLDGTHPLGERLSRPEGVVIDIEGMGGTGGASAQGTQSTASTPPEGAPMGRQPTLLRAEEDVCFPVDECSSIHSPSHPGAHHDPRTGRRITRGLPDLSVLEEWSREEKEQRSEGIRAKKTNEP